MRYLRSDWHARIQDVLGEFKAANLAVSRLIVQVDADSNIVSQEAWVREHLTRTRENLEGTYLVRMFASFEAALRSYDRDHFRDAKRETVASVMIDQLGSQRRIAVHKSIRDGVHRVRKVRNYWAHDTDIDPGLMSMSRARGYLQSYLDRFPTSWGDPSED